MIIRDSFGIIVGDTSGDGGDSLNREGIFSFLTGQVSDGLKICLYEKEYPVRHPYDEPWDNYKNCSRDQLTPAICVGFKLKDKDISKRCLQTVIDHKGFAPNSERDYPGSTKLPRPHEFMNEKGEVEKRLFDYADPITPELWYLMLKGAGHDLKAALLYPIALVWVHFAIFSHCTTYARNPHNDDAWQLACIADCFGLLLYFDDHHPYGLDAAAESYYSGWRGTSAFSLLWRGYLDKQRLV